MNLEGEGMLFAFAELRDVRAGGKGIEIPFCDAEGTALLLSVGGRVHIDGKGLRGEEAEESSSELHCE